MFHVLLTFFAWILLCKIFIIYSINLSYKDSGVDIDAGDYLVQRIKPLARGTTRPGVIGGLGGFGGLFRINDVSFIKIRFRETFLLEEFEEILKLPTIFQKIWIAIWINLRSYATKIEMGNRFRSPIQCW